MERDVRYFVVGLTVAVLVAVLIGFVVWQAQRYGDNQARMYTITVEGAVTGLDRGSAVNYMGVRKGRVTDLRLSSQDSEKVNVEIRLQPDVPISASTRARIKPQGITGQSYVALRTPDPEAGAPARPDWAAHPVIEARSSRIDTLLEEMPEIADRLGRVAERATRLLSDDNIEAASAILANAETFSGRLDELGERLNRLSARAERTLGRTDAAMDAVRAGSQRVDVAMEELRGTARALTAVATRLERQLERNGPAIDAVFEQDLPELRGLIRDLRRTATTFERLGRDLDENPAQLIHRRPNPGKEVPQ